MTMVPLARGFQDLEETGEKVLLLIKSFKSEPWLPAVTEGHQRLFERRNDVKKTITQLLSDLTHAEEGVVEHLLGLERQKSELSQELESLEQELQRSVAKNQTMDAELQFLQRELGNLQNSEREIQNLQEEVDEDTTEVIPSAIYLAQLYHKVTKIKWEHDNEPGILKGVHYGEDLATPINVDTSSQSKCAVSDYLWSFVSTDW